MLHLEPPLLLQFLTISLVSLLRHIENLEEGEVVKPLQIHAFQDDLRHDEVDVVFLELYLGEELEQVLLRDGALAVLPVGNSRQDLLVV